MVLPEETTGSSAKQLAQKAFGLWGETVAAEYLKAQGYLILERNWRYSRQAEIDLVAYRPLPEPALCFIEVKTRRHDTQSAVEQTTPSKLARMGEAALAYAQTYLGQAASVKQEWLPVHVKNQASQPLPLPGQSPVGLLLLLEWILVRPSASGPTGQGKPAQIQHFSQDLAGNLLHE